MPCGISVHAPLNLTISLARSPGLKLWHLSRFWAQDDMLQEPLLEAICNFWVLNGDFANAMTVWDTFKSWVRGEYISRISSLQKEASSSLEGLEGKAARCEARYIASSTGTTYPTWQMALRDLSLYNVEQNKKSMLHSTQRIF